MKLKGLNYSELLDYMTGVFLMDLGKGCSAREIVGTIWNISLMWKSENELQTIKRK